MQGRWVLDGHGLHRGRLREDQAAHRRGDGLAIPARLWHSGCAGGKRRRADCPTAQDPKPVGGEGAADVEGRLGQGLRQVDPRAAEGARRHQQLWGDHGGPDVHLLDGFRGCEGVLRSRRDLPDPCRVERGQGEGLVAERRGAWRGLRPDCLPENTLGCNLVAREAHLQGGRSGREEHERRRRHGDPPAKARRPRRPAGVRARRIPREGASRRRQQRGHPGRGVCLQARALVLLPVPRGRAEARLARGALRAARRPREGELLLARDRVRNLRSDAPLRQRLGRPTTARHAVLVQPGAGGVGARRGEPLGHGLRDPGRRVGVHRLRVLVR
mmetsp:Transcript_139725/g.348415  ORF Transcript_139725/g.348415 Transcript_139725/m.348415 type:complete len:329 (+) Transcript_139725:72-1058(+)